jgi:hypothetical protein
MQLCSEQDPPRALFLFLLEVQKFLCPALEIPAFLLLADLLGSLRFELRFVICLLRWFFIVPRNLFRYSRHQLVWVFQF